MTQGQRLTPIPGELQNETEPTAPQVVRVPPAKRRKKSRRWLACCLPIAALFLAGSLLVGAYFLFPVRTNLLLLGIDRPPEGTDLARTDTIILTTIIPDKPYVGMLSIPRDLWVNVPGMGENRINTAHFYGEMDQTGSGPERALETVRQNFGVTVDYYVRIRFDSLVEVVNSLGGVDILLDSPMSGYKAGSHHLDGDQALAFVRDRAGTDDFFRMARGQLFIKALWQQLLNPRYWPSLPRFFEEASHLVDTNVPVWLWPRLGLALLRAGPGGIDARVISRDMVNPFTTNMGAQVLGPIWERINPVLLEMFGQ